jgi:hypothetical protein
MASVANSYTPLSRSVTDSSLTPDEILPLSPASSRMYGKGNPFSLCWWFCCRFLRRHWVVILSDVGASASLAAGDDWLNLCISLAHGELHESATTSSSIISNCDLVELWFLFYSKQYKICHNF